jgi:DNA-binding NarL/FixJ family response regulator
MKTAYIIEDEEILRTLLSTFFEMALPDIELLGTTGHGGQGVEDCRKLKPDFVVVDLQLPDLGGLEILRILKDECPEIKVLIYSGNDSPQIVEQAKEANADGFICKVSGMDEFERAINVLRAGEKFFEISEPDAPR